MLHELGHVYLALEASFREDGMGFDAPDFKACCPVQTQCRLIPFSEGERESADFWPLGRSLGGGLQ